MDRRQYDANSRGSNSIIDYWHHNDLFICLRCCASWRPACRGLKVVPSCS